MVAYLEAGGQALLPLSFVKAGIPVVPGPRSFWVVGDWHWRFVGVMSSGLLGVVRRSVRWSGFVFFEDSSHFDVSVPCRIRASHGRDLSTMVLGGLIIFYYVWEGCMAPRVAMTSKGVDVPPRWLNVELTDCGLISPLIEERRRLLASPEGYWSLEPRRGKTLDYHDGGLCSRDIAPFFTTPITSWLGRNLPVDKDDEHEWSSSVGESLPSY
ncbi:hypothetical protein D9615_009164 [Tricholomella constricta]|uniref:Uncharacterized protein n=1 Tax=Tricholomella constricta TaxID=117010 RepID=A0A8H5H2C5_9AGAR|nr:hypothetical protein D9615_009164 [Tricholomella constricta]